jgi:excisionase family DNA binding protein
LTSGPLLTVKQVAEALGVCTATVYALCERGLLVHVRVMHSIRISAAALGAVMAQSRS